MDADPIANQIANTTADPKPVPPDADDYTGCCDSGCTPCVYDRYWEALARYEAALAAWQVRQEQQARQA